MQITLKDNLVRIDVNVDYRGLSQVESDFLTNRTEELLRSAIAGLRGRKPGNPCAEVNFKDPTQSVRHVTAPEEIRKF